MVGIEKASELGSGEPNEPDLDHGLSTFSDNFAVRKITHGSIHDRYGVDRLIFPNKGEAFFQFSLGMETESQFAGQYELGVTLMLISLGLITQMKDPAL